MFEPTRKQLLLLYLFYVGLSLLGYVGRDITPDIRDLLGYGGMLWLAYVLGTAFVHVLNKRES